jgi:hypothetical protein
MTQAIRIGCFKLEPICRLYRVEIWRNDWHWPVREATVEAINPSWAVARANLRHCGRGEYAANPVRED